MPVLFTRSRSFFPILASDSFQNIAIRRHQKRGLGGRIVMDVNINLKSTSRIAQNNYIVLKLMSWLWVLLNVTCNRCYHNIFRLCNAATLSFQTIAKKKNSMPVGAWVPFITIIFWDWGSCDESLDKVLHRSRSIYLSRCQQNRDLEFTADHNQLQIARYWNPVRSDTLFHTK